MSIQQDINQPKINHETCTKCFSCVRECPLEAIVIEERQVENSKSSLKSVFRMTGYFPYQVSETFKQMTEAKTIFARVQYDPSFQFYQKTEFFGAESMISKDIPDYGRFEHDLSVAAWKL
ncbi:MAG: hypothetical protein ACFFCX_08925, partial [Candidatus Sifarchaeia archaeon]